MSIYFFILLSVKDMINNSKKQVNISKISTNNIEELLIKEYYTKYLPKNSNLVKKPNTIYDKELLNNYCKIFLESKRV